MKKRANIAKTFRVVFVLMLMMFVVYLSAAVVQDLNTEHEFTRSDILRFAAEAERSLEQEAEFAARMVQEAAREQGGTGSFTGQNLGGVVFHTDVPIIEELLTFANINSNAAVIAENFWRFPRVLLDLTVRNPEMIDFTAGFLNYGQNTSVDCTEIDISRSLTPEGGIPHFLQWDCRWGYSLFMGEIMAVTGSAPTALSMVVVGLTGNAALNPRHMADFAARNNHVAGQNLSADTFIREAAEVFGISSSVITTEVTQILTALSRGEVIISQARAGKFSPLEHFIVITSANPNGTVNILDPLSMVGSNRALDTLIPQIRSSWAFRP